MGDLLKYIEQLESMGFFSAYPLVYVLLFAVTENSKNEKIKKIVRLVPYSYALTGLLYLGLQLKNLYPDYSFEHLKASAELPLLKLWGVLAILFFIPWLAKKPILSLLHSFVFFFFLLNDLFFQKTSDSYKIRNDMKIYTDSLILNIGTFLFIVLLYLVITFFRNSRSPRNAKSL